MLEVAVNSSLQPFSDLFRINFFPMGAFCATSSVCFFNYMK